ncbi:MAG TPA: Gfo/Idh/MocA family oxidoreductase [Pyrinomonadaceae bacterium]|nr:Gfo/Idh/MocA family oxidoreductase [Pyrinomonadaceae bacterium]
MLLRTAAIGTGHLGRQHARIHAALAAEGRAQFVAVCDADEATARRVAAERETEWTTDWQSLLGRVDAVSLAVPTESHAEIACRLLDAGVHVLVEKPISRTLAEADEMIASAARGRAVLMVGQLERFNPALTALHPHVRKPLYFEIHRIGEFTARSLDIDVVLDLMIHDLDIVQWLVGSDVEVTDVRAVGIPVLTERVDAANARIEFASGAVANITASRVGTEKIRKMRFFQPHDYVAVDYATRHASVSSLAPPPDPASARPGVHSRILEIADIEPLRAEIEAFLAAAATGQPPPITGADGRRALALALRVLERIHEHTDNAGLHALAAARQHFNPTAES